MRDWTGYRIIYDSINDTEDSLVVVRRHGPYHYIARWKNGSEGVLSSNDLFIYAGGSTIIPPKRIVIKKFFEDA